MYGNSNMNRSGNFVNAASNPYVQNQYVQNQQQQQYHIQQQQMMPALGGPQPARLVKRFPYFIS